MKIDNSIKGLQSATAPAPSSDRSVAATHTIEPLGAQVELSRTATRLLQKEEDHSAARVAELRQAIAEGRFQINPERIADGLLDSVRSLLSSDRRQAGA